MNDHKSTDAVVMFVIAVIAAIILIVGAALAYHKYLM